MLSIAFEDLRRHFISAKAAGWERMEDFAFLLTAHLKYHVLKIAFRAAGLLFSSALTKEAWCSQVGPTLP